ncbi:PREDICTED: RING-H2 finger protein ATL7-like [Camelina sativa]|uniref:RING-type E3 ubiquitin transferase n=1 Tax=Camelina sativa TaxID=90675 RepID=A0ABM0VFK0_CAMSA|nr:PREDICTED: RING-H2 finger protein ATL7-like [Camelina sativa]
MSYSDPNPNPIPGTYIPSNSNGAAEKMKAYQAIIFSIPICFTFIVLFVLYVVYLRRNSAASVDWSSLGMRGGAFVRPNNLSTAESGLSKDVREMLPVVIYKESFSVKDSQCSVCLGDYQANEKLQQMPSCGHTFHMECIDIWLTSHATCPLCRLSLIQKPSLDKSPQGPEVVSSMENSNGGGGASAQPESQSSTTEATIQISDGQEGNGGNQVVISKETEENERDSVGTTSDGCWNRKVG